MANSRTIADAVCSHSGHNIQSIVIEEAIVPGPSMNVIKKYEPVCTKCGYALKDILTMRAKNPGRGKRPVAPPAV